MPTLALEHSRSSTNIWGKRKTWITVRDPIQAMKACLQRKPTVKAHKLEANNVSVTLKSGIFARWQREVLCQEGSQRRRRDGQVGLGRGQGRVANSHKEADFCKMFQHSWAPCTCSPLNHCFVVWSSHWVTLRILRRCVCGGRQGAKVGTERKEMPCGSKTKEQQRAKIKTERWKE